MKFTLVLVALIATTGAVPTSLANHHENHGVQQSPNNANAAQPNPSAQPQQANPSNGRGGHEHNRGGQRGGTNAQPPAKAPAPAVTTPVAAAAVQGGQQTAGITNTGSAGRNNGNGQNQNNAQKQNTGQNSNVNGQNNNNGAVNPNLVPDFGQQPGLQPNGAGSCKTDLGKLIPCSCPPSRAAFLQKLGQFVKAGSFPGGGAAPFPTGNSNADARTRIDTIVSTLQNFDGSPGKGCPAISAPNFQAEQKRLQG